ncbi:hypothetical protein CPLU01_11277 [Colletotrichum plurivorum]|uniref:Uncharacterized protein n=1 Tax=Colletotrichum plurivorum TaxID=2175906 RepID=A0A8H6K3D6_9PEZI|nr:hypothetical protein CPLU01_11277 [Colletotrichum plurivorum]
MEAEDAVCIKDTEGVGRCAEVSPAASRHMSMDKHNAACGAIGEAPQWTACSDTRARTNTSGPTGYRDRALPLTLGA